MINVAMTWYPGKERGGPLSDTLWVKMSQVPARGQTVHLPIVTDGEPDSIALYVSSVSWCDALPKSHPDHGNPDWHAELTLSQRMPS